MSEPLKNRSAPATHPEVVTVELDNTDRELDAVVDAAERAGRDGLPLQLAVAHLPPTAHADPRRIHLMQRLDLAVELARSVAPGLEVRLPVDNPIEYVEPEQHR